MLVGTKLQQPPILQRKNIVFFKTPTSEKAVPVVEEFCFVEKQE